ncbi:MAG: TonB-dependent receptor plug domain-containing protein [Bacteroidaceae bacterium]|nr:TonB-dependent receptor plug domain-containing protein [Bacteroidaceae bacterium]
MNKFICILGTLALLSQVLLAQNLTGVILKDGKPQKNVSVWMKIGKASALTDKSGQFTLSNVLAEDTLQISVSSKYDAKIVVGELKNIIINLGKENFTVEGGLEEIKVPYTPVPQMKRGSKITHDVIMRSGMKNVTDVIRRFVPGAQESASFGEKVLSITRGNNSMRGPEPPLYVVDDIPYEVSNPNDIVAVEDIAELSVDRDGTAYGARGANGVVIIKTLRGNE